MAVTSRDLHRQPARTSPFTVPRLRLPGGNAWLAPAVYIFLGVALLSVATGRAGIWLDDLRYGRPRTMQLSTYVGHGEQPGQPTHFIAMNLNRRVVVWELPGGDATKTRTLQGPYLFGAAEHLTPILLRVEDINADERPDLVVGVKNEEIIYINSGDSFRLITDEERQQLLEERG